MSNLPERPWTEEEKYTLLTEIMKKAGFPSHHLVKMIRDFNVSPSWADIPLPSGRSLNSCQLAFFNMCQQHVQASVNPGRPHFPPPRHESSAPPAAPLDSSNTRKRPLYPADKPILAPRAIQPRPATSTASFSSESGASALLSPSTESVTTRGEPPRKRGRPSKAESERRKAAAEARGETYPPPRRSSSNKIKVPSAPTSPAGVQSIGPPFAPQMINNRSPNVLQPELRYAPPPGRPMRLIGPSEGDRPRDLPNRDIAPAMRELPRPTEIRQTLPSPQTLQLGHRETIPRVEPSERPFERLPPDRISFVDRRTLIHPATRRPEEPPVSGPDISLRTPAEKRPE